MGWLREGAWVDRFRLLSCHASSAMGAVWRAEEAGTAHPVALKLTTRGAAAAARALQGIRHPHVVRVLAVGEADDHDFLAMDWVEGRPLPAWLQEAPGWRQVLEVLCQAGAGLGAAHRAGVVHGDFKPDNVLVDGAGAARVIDFGGAPRACGQTAGYLAPERSFGAPADPLSDQFAYCCAAYEALFGRLPFASRDERLFGAPAAPPEGPAATLFAPLRRGLQADPGLRYRDLDGLLADMANVCAPAPIGHPGHRS